jgi:glucosamine 6-phosphate synthetase-like amidotransferase/phosphosugar isomerase protein
VRLISLQAMGQLSDNIKDVLNLDSAMEELATSLAKERSLLVMGRGYQYATCLEGALKIKELTYMHSEGILSGELKHGPLAMVDENMPVIMIVMNVCFWVARAGVYLDVICAKRVARKVRCLWTRCLLSRRTRR